MQPTIVIKNTPKEPIAKPTIKLVLKPIIIDEAQWLTGC